MKHERSVKVTLWAGRLAVLVVAAVAVGMPAVLQWYGQVRALAQDEKMAILIAFYCCVPAVGLALWNMDRLLRRILQGDVFVQENVGHIRVIRWCCAGVSAICVPASVFYLPLVFMVVIMAFLCLAVSVVCGLMTAAVAIREENDLTV